MYRIEHRTQTMVFSSFRFSRMKLLGEFFQEITSSLDEVNKATVDGKALDQLQDRLVGPFRVRDVAVSESTRLTEELDVSVFVPNEIAAEEKLRIKAETMKVNLRYGSRLRTHVIVDNRRKE